VLFLLLVVVVVVVAVLAVVVVLLVLLLVVLLMVVTSAACWFCLLVMAFVHVAPHSHTQGDVPPQEPNRSPPWCPVASYGLEGP
jgi:hypothetical protein